MTLFSEILKNLRKSRKLSQQQLAQEIFVSPSAVSQYEIGRALPSRETLERIAQYFGVSTDYLMGHSANADVEELLNQEYYRNIRVSDLIRKCMNITGKDREALLVLIDALEYQSEQSE